MPRTIQVHQVDAFTRIKFTGNPAGVVLEADALTDAEMLAIDPTPGFFVHSQIALISVARTGERTMTREADLAATDR